MGSATGDVEDKRCKDPELYPLMAVRGYVDGI